MRALLFTFLLSGLFSQVLHSQITVVGRRDLRFGTLFPGIPELVVPTDGARAGRFSIRGPRNMEIVITFTLPAVMVGPGAATMPLSYAANDAIYEPRGVAHRLPWRSTPPCRSSTGCRTAAEPEYTWAPRPRLPSVRPPAITRRL